MEKPVTDRQIAVQEKTTYVTQIETQKERQQLENATAQADMQKEVVKSERGVEISKNLANSEIQKATGTAEDTKIKAKADAENVKVIAGAEAESVKLRAAAEAERTSSVGNAEAEVILNKGKAQAEAYELSVKAMGQDYAKLQMIESIVSGNIKLIPENIIIGGENGGSIVENFLGISMIEKLTGKEFNSKPTEDPKLKVAKKEPKA